MGMSCKVYISDLIGEVGFENSYNSGFAKSCNSYYPHKLRVLDALVLDEFPRTSSLLDIASTCTDRQERTHNKSALLPI
jgi:hypothetical protein